MERGMVGSGGCEETDADDGRIFLGFAEASHGVGIVVLE